MTEKQLPARTPYRNSGFISYSHGRDRQLAMALRRGLRSLGRKWFRVRNQVGILLDQAGLSANPALWSSIERELTGSEFFILLACPESAASEWVQREIQTWLSHEPGSAERLLVVLTGGEIRWNPVTGDFDWETTTAVPRCLAGVFRQVPLYVDARPLRAGHDHSLKDPAFTDCVANLLAPLRHTSKQQIIDEEFRERRKATRVWMGVAAALALLGAGLAASLRETRKQSRVAVSRRLIAESELAAREPDLLERGVLLGLEAMRREDSPEAENAVRQALFLLPKPVAQFPHRRAVVNVAFSRDGAFVAAACLDGKARLFDVRSHKEVRSFPGSAPLTTIGLDSAEKRVLTVTEDGIVRVFGFETGQELRSWDLHGKGAVASISPDGEFVAAGTNSGDGLLLSVASGGTAWSSHLSEPVLLAAFSRGGDFCLYGARNGEVLKVDVKARRAASFQGLYSGATALAISADGRWLASGARDGSVQVHSLDAGTQRLAVSYGAPVTALALDAEGTHVAIGLSDGSAMVLSGDGKQQFSIRYGSLVFALEFSPDGAYVGAASWDRSARILEMRSGSEVLRKGHEGPVLAFAFSPDGKYAASSAGDGVVAVYDARPAGAPGFKIAPGQKIAGVSCTDRNWAIAFAGSHVSIFDVASGAETARFEDLANVESLKLSDDDRYLATVERGGTGKLIRVADKAVVAGFAASPAIPCMTFSHASRRFAAANPGGTLTVFDTGTGAAVARLPHWGQVISASFSADASRIATASFDRNVRVFDLRTGAEQHRFGGPGSPFAVAFSPKDNTLATGYDGSVTLRNIDSGQNIWAVRTLDYVTSVAFDGSGERVAVAGRDNSARVLSSRSGIELSRVDHRREVIEVRFSADGTLLRTVDLGLTVRSHPLGAAALEAEARSRLTRDLSAAEKSKFLGEGTADAAAPPGVEPVVPAARLEAPEQPAPPPARAPRRGLCASDAHEIAVTGKVDCSDVARGLAGLNASLATPLRDALDRGDFAEAQRLLDRALAGPDPRPDLAAPVFFARSQLSRMQLKFATALPDVERACTLAPDRADYCTGFARTLADLGNRSKAEALFHSIVDAIPGPERRVFNETVILGRAKFGLAGLAIDAGDLDAAERYNREALEIFTSAAKEHPAYGMFVGLTLLRTGFVHTQRGQMEQAEASYREAVEVTKGSMDARTGLGISSAGDCQSQFGNYLLRRGRIPEAEQAFREAMHLYAESAKADPALPNTSWSGTLHNFGLLYAQTGRHAAVQALLNDALSRFRVLRDHNPGAYDVHLASTLLDLALYHQMENQPAKAYPLLEQAHGIYTRILNEDPESYGDRLALACVELVKLLYTSAGNPE